MRGAAQPIEKKRARAKRFWRVMNPAAKPLAGWVPWWVVLETTGRVSGRPRQVPLARGPREGDVLWLASVHGARAAFARNIQANPRVRVKMGGRWREGRASLEPMDDERLRGFNAYARSGPRVLGIEPVLVRVELS